MQCTIKGSPAASLGEGGDNGVDCEVRCEQGGGSN